MVFLLLLAILVETSSMKYFLTLVFCSTILISGFSQKSQSDFADTPSKKYSTTEWHGQHPAVPAAILPKVQTPTGTPTPAQYPDLLPIQPPAQGGIFFYQATDFSAKLLQISKATLGIVVLLFSLFLYFRSSKQLYKLDSNEIGWKNQLLHIFVYATVFSCVGIFWLDFFKSYLEGFGLMLFNFTILLSLLPYGVALFNYIEFIVKSPSHTAITKGERLSSLIASFITATGFISSIITILNEFKSPK